MFVVILVLLGHLGGLARLAAETGPMIDPQVRTAVATGRARVVVNLRIPGGARPEGALSAADAAAQRTAIVAAQQGVVARLSGTGFSVSRRFTTVPQLALEIGADALRALERMDDLVISVRADRAVPPTG